MKKILAIFMFLFFAMCQNSSVLAKEKIQMINKDTGVYVFKINTKKYGDKIKPYMTKTLTTPQKVYEENCFDLVVNGGFFDVKNGKSVSYVIINDEIVADVTQYEQLISNLKAQNRLEKVLSRAELRILENDKQKIKFDIALHSDEVPKGYKIKHSLQAGPMLLPTMDLAREGFVVIEDGIVKSQSVDILKRRERTALGLRGNYLYIVLFTKDCRVDANEMKDYMQNKLKLKKIMALDGGLSTALNYKDISIGSLGKYQRRVKSFLVIEK